MLRVNRTREQIRAGYNKLSRFYDYLGGFFEKKYKKLALMQLQVQEGENVLEIGFGTGKCLKQIAEQVGETGRVCGIDISDGMLKVTHKRLRRAGLIHRVELYREDAMELPFDANTFDSVFMSFTLELFDTPEIPVILEQIQRVLRPGGKFGVVSLSRDYGRTIPVKIYEWFHKRFPRYIDCRPIYVKQVLKSAGFYITNYRNEKLFGLPLAIVTAKN